MALETNYGVPTVAVHTHVFARLVRSVALANGMPTTRQAFVPQPVVGARPPSFAAYIEGDGSGQRRPFMRILDRRPDASARRPGSRGPVVRPLDPRLLDADTEENLHSACSSRIAGPTSLPVVLPTEERVAAMLAGTSHAPDKVVGRLRPTAFASSGSSRSRRSPSTLSWRARPRVLAGHPRAGRERRLGALELHDLDGDRRVVNGPIRNEIGMNYGIGAIGPYNHANATIGRAYGLLSQNLQGGSVPGETYMGSQGNTSRYNAYVRRERGAQPLGAVPCAARLARGREHRHRGLFLGERVGRVPAELLAGEARRNDLGARARDGMHARAWIRSWRAEFVETRPRDEGADRPLDTPERQDPAATRFWDHVTCSTLIHEEVEAGVEPFASYWKAPPDELIPVFEPGGSTSSSPAARQNGHFSIFQGSPMRAKFRTNKGQKATVSIDEWR